MISLFGLLYAVNEYDFSLEVRLEAEDRMENKYENINTRLVNEIFKVYFYRK